jgi:hypothetical protein
MIDKDTTALDTATLTIGMDLDATDIGFRIRQRFPLLTMWFQVVPNTWSNTNGWLVDPNECIWEGVSCEDRMDTVTGVTQSAVTRLFFNGSGSYVGNIPPDTGLLSNLEHFEIRDTIFDLNGTLLDTMGLLTALTYFDVFNNGLGGALPDTIGQWTALTFFNVYFNFLSGFLPDSIGGTRFHLC